MLYVSAVCAVTRCLSDCPSVTLLDCIQMAKDIANLLSPPHSLIILVFDPQQQYQTPRGTLSAGMQNTRGGKILRFSTEIAIYLDGTR